MVTVGDWWDLGSSTCSSAEVAWMRLDVLLSEL